MSHSLDKSLSFGSLVTLGAAGIIGSGWIYMTSDFFQRYGAGGVLLGMLIAIALAGCVSLAFAELVSRYPYAGGDLLFVFIAYNRKAAFVVGWLLIGAFISNTAFYMAAFGSLLSRGFPALAPLITRFPLYRVAGAQVYLFGLVAGMALVALFYLLNLISISSGARTQKVLFSIKLLLGLMLAVTGLGYGHWHNLLPLFHPSATGSHSVAAPIMDSLRFVIPSLTFLTGLSLVSLLAEETSLPPRRIGQAAVVAVLLAGAYYLLVLLATAMIIPWQQSEGMPLGAISTFRAAGYPALGYAATGIALLGAGTGSLALALACSRVILAMGRGGLLPTPLARVNRRGVPINALTATFILTVLLGLLGKSAMVWFLDTGGIYIGLSWTLVVMCLYRIRRRPDAQIPPYRVRHAWLPALGGVAAIGSIVMAVLPGTAISLMPAEYLILLLWCLIGLVIGFFQLRKPGLSEQQSLERMLSKS